MALFKSIFLWLCLFSPTWLSPTADFRSLPKLGSGKNFMKEFDGERVTGRFSTVLRADESTDCLTIRGASHPDKLGCITIDFEMTDMQTTSFEGTTILPNRQRETKEGWLELSPPTEPSRLLIRLGLSFLDLKATISSTEWLQRIVQQYDRVSSLMNFRRVIHFYKIIHGSLDAGLPEADLLSNYLKLNKFAATNPLFSEQLLDILEQSEEAQRALVKMIKLHYQEEFKPKTTISLGQIVFSSRQRPKVFFESALQKDVGLLEKLDRSSLMEQLQSRHSISTKPGVYQEMLKGLGQLRPSWFKFITPSSAWDFKDNDVIDEGIFLIQLGLQQLVSLHLPASEAPADSQHDSILSVYKLFQHLSTYSPTLDNLIFKEFTDPHSSYSKDYRWILLTTLNSKQANPDAVENMGGRPNFLSKLYADHRFSNEIKASKELNQIIDAIPSSEIPSDPDNKFKNVFECFRLFVHYNSPSTTRDFQLKFGIVTLSQMVNFLLQRPSKLEPKQASIISNISKYIHNYHDSFDLQFQAKGSSWPDKNKIVAFLRDYPTTLKPIWPSNYNKNPDNFRETFSRLYKNNELIIHKNFPSEPFLNQHGVTPLII